MFHMSAGFGHMPAKRRARSRGVQLKIDSWLWLLGVGVVVVEVLVVVLPSSSSSSPTCFIITNPPSNKDDTNHRHNIVNTRSGQSRFRHSSERS